MTLLFIRIFFFIICSIVGYYVGSFSSNAVLGLQVGSLFGLLIIFVEKTSRSVSVRGLSSMVFGLVLGVFMAKLVSDILMLIPLGAFVHSVTRVALTLFFSYLGAVMALRGKDEFNLIIPYVRFKRQDSFDSIILLDTCVIIDGRIIDVYKTHFLTGRLLVPDFILKEMQTMADSSDDIKRQKGRRGLELLRLMQKDSDIDIRIDESDVKVDSDADAQLIKLAKMMEARLCTLDFNLARVAVLQGIQVLNIHKLHNSLKTVVFPGEKMGVLLIREGKEDGQAVGYMDDGTMIVVSNAREHIGGNVRVEITSVLQTQAGKMIFADLNNN